MNFFEKAGSWNPVRFGRLDPLDEIGFERIQLLGALGALIFEYGKALWSAKMYDEAVAQFSKKITDFGGGSLDYYYLGRANYSGKHYAAADSAFALFAERNATSPDGHIWRAKCNSSIDAEMKTGAALPHYQKFIELAAAEPDKNKRNLIEAYSFMTAYFANAKDMETAKANSSQSSCARS